MSESHKNIDPFFKENLKDYKVSPPDHLWNKIEASLPQKNKKRGMVIWLLPTGIAASLLLFFGLYLNNSSINHPIQVTETSNDVKEICPEEELKDTVQNASTNSKIKNEVDQLTGNPKKPVTIQSKSESDYNSAYANNSAKSRKETKIQNRNVVSVNELTTSVKNNVAKKTDYNKNNINKNLKRTETNLNSEFPTSNSNKPESFVTETNKTELKQIENPVTEKNAIKNQITQTEEPETKEKESKKASKNWSIQPQVAPLFYDSFSGGSPIAQSFADNDQSTKTDLSYGIKIAYQFSDKLSVRTGVSTASVNIVTNEVGISTNATDNETFSSINGISGITDLNSPNNSVKDNGGSVGIKANPPPNTLIPNIPTNNVPVIGTVNGSLVQDLNYIEIPLELAYQLIDKKIGLQLIGGMSTLLLDSNSDQLIFRSENKQDNPGTLNNLNQTSFSGNFGVGLDYNIAPNFKISVEPVMKVQFNAFNDNTDFNPYFFGIYSGIKFRL